MLDKVEVRNEQGALLTLDLMDVSNGYLLKDIEGLDPVPAVLVSSSFATMDGEQYQSSRRGKRNMVFKIGYEPDYTTSTVRQLRSQLYRYFMPKTQVKLRFYMTDGLVVDISARVESFDSSMFAQNPSASISLLAFNSDFVDLTEITIPGMTVPDSTETLVEYDGTVDTGIKFTLNVDRPIASFSIIHIPEDNTFRSLFFSTPLVAGDIVDIVTIPGSKGATLTRGGNGSSVLYGVSPYSNWIALAPGTNRIRVSVGGAGIPYTIKYSNRYGGL